MKNLNKYLLFFVVVGIVPCVSCGKQIDPYQLKQKALDRVQHEYYPEEDEFKHIPKTIFISFGKGFEGRKDIGADIFFEIEEALSKYANIEVVGKYEGVQVEANEEALLKVGNNLNVNYVAIITVQNWKKNDENIEGTLNVEAYSVEIGRKIWSSQLVYMSSNFDNFREGVKNMVEFFFPLKGFLIETRNNREVGLVNLGKNLNITKGRVFLIYEREVKIRGFNANQLSRIRQIEYSTEPIVEVEVILVEEERAWVVIPEEKRKVVLAGHSVFLKYE